MNYLKILLAALGVAREFLAYLNSREMSKKEKAKEAVDFARALKDAKKSGDTSYIESVFNRMPNSDKTDS